jgi:ABC-type sugar transport system ATPase subunit
MPASWNSSARSARAAAACSAETLTAAVAGLSFTVRPGELLGLVGPNGAGKTTTLRCLAGIIPATQGIIRLAGHDLARDPVAAKQELAFFSDEPRLFDCLTVRQHLEFTARLYQVTGTDGNGMSDADELFAGCDPGDPQSVIRLLAVDRVNDTTIRARWRRVAGRSHRLESSANLNQWQDAGTHSATGLENSQEAGVPADAASRFFRVAVLAP